MTCVCSAFGDFAFYHHQPYQTTPTSASALGYTATNLLNEQLRSTCRFYQDRHLTQYWAWYWVTYLINEYAAWRSHVGRSCISPIHFPPDLLSLKRSNISEIQNVLAAPIIGMCSPHTLCSSLFEFFQGVTKSEIWHLRRSGFEVGQHIAKCKTNLASIDNGSMSFPKIGLVRSAYLWEMLAHSDLKLKLL